MILLIDGKPAAIKEGTSIEYNSENRLFHDREDYTMNIELPLHCRENAAIFGHISRKDASIEKIYFDADLIDRHWRKSGAAVITNITDNMVKVQFIAGRSYQNFYPKFDDTYIDEIELDAIPLWLPDNYRDIRGGNNRNDRTSTRGRGATGRGGGAATEDKTYLTPQEAWGNGDIIALSWVNATTGNIQNRADYSWQTRSYKWHVVEEDEYDTEIVRGLSCQIRLYRLTQMIFEKLGYTFMADEWRQSDYYHLYSFNCIPSAWDGGRWNETLPHWSVNEFLENLEKLLYCELEVDHKEKTIRFSWANEKSAAAGVVAIDDVVDEFTASVTKDDDSQYLATRNIGYADGGHNMSNLYSCDWYFRKNKVLVEEVETLYDLMTLLNEKPVRWFQGEALEIIFHVAEVDNYFIMYVQGRYLVDSRQMVDVMKYANAYRLVPLNAFGARIFDEDNWDEQEDIGIIPVWVDETDKGWVAFFEAGDLDNQSSSGECYKHSINGHDMSDTDGEFEADQILQSYRVRRIKEGDNNGRTSYSTLQVGFWYGEQMHGNLPCPMTDEYEIVNDAHYEGGHLSQNYWVRYAGGAYDTFHGSLRLNSNQYGQGRKLMEAVKIESLQKYEFSFLMDGMPDVMATYIIRGKKYLCSSIKAEITESGMSKLKKGVFYRVLE